MSTTRKRAGFSVQALAAAIAVGIAGQAHAASFNIGEIEGQFDSSLSVGASWSMSEPDKDFIGANNGGRGLSQTSDDSHLNFKRGETFSKIFKGIHDLELKYQDTGIFLRGKYWYDFELKDEDRPFKDISDSGRKEGAKSSGAEMLDAFVYHNYNIGDLPGTVRLGKQVVSWGESTFIQNGINSINPIDVSAFRRPGAEVKEGLIPVNMFYLSQNVTDSLSVDGFYQLEWDQTVVDNCGTFFSQPDVVADGCSNNLAVLSPKLAPFGPAFGYQTTSEGVIVPRAGDKDARDGGQYGMALHWMSDALNTEFGGYYMNYHSRLPILGVNAADQATYRESLGILTGRSSPAVPAAARQGVAIANVAAGSSYFMSYPEDIHLYGLSFSTTLPTGTAWQGEISYRPNAPVQINTTDLLYGGVRGLAQFGGPLGAFSNFSLAGGDPASIPGSTLKGYERKEITQLQTTFTHFLDQVMGAERLTLVGEIGWTHVGGLESTNDVRYGRDPVFGPGELPSGTCTAINAGAVGANGKNVNRYCDSDGFTTADSWGYRARAIWDYNNVFAGINLKPNLAWSHDVDGYSPGPGGNFEEGRKAISVGVDADYLNTYTASLSYTDFFGGDYNTMSDRDFIALSLGVNF